jgi:hypothetical protein
MKKTIAVSLLFATLMGCDSVLKPLGPDFDTDSDADTDADTDTDDTDTNADTDTDTDDTDFTMPDPFGSMEIDWCQQQAQYDPEVPTATRYFVGDFTIFGDKVEGLETAIYFVNDALATSMGAPKCEAIWGAAGSTDLPLNCSKCDFSVALDAQLSNSDCPASFTSGQETFSVVYDVALAENNECIVYFGESGTTLGEWYHHNDRFIYRTEPTCVVF